VNFQVNASLNQGSHTSSIHRYFARNLTEKCGVFEISTRQGYGCFDLFRFMVNVEKLYIRQARL
jgi:hypothetical protein